MSSSEIQSKGKNMALKLIGRKKGMTRLFDENGNVVVCTVIHAEPNVVSQLKKKDIDGYEGVQLAAFQVKATKSRNVGKPLVGHFSKAGINPRSKIKESRVESSEQYTVGQEITVEQFADCTFVDVTAISKGKGFQGVMKRHNFAGGPAAHGSGFHRHGGSTGMRSSPGRCLPGQKKAGRMGGEVVTVQNLKVIMVDAPKQVILVEGAVPGARGGVVYISKAIKKASVTKTK
jgi:large subunit ribosomal protein L3